VAGTLKTRTIPEGGVETGTRSQGIGADPLHIGILTTKENEMEEDEIIITRHARTALHQLPLLIHPPSQNRLCHHAVVGAPLLAPGMTSIVGRGKGAGVGVVESAAAAAEVAAVSVIDDTRIRRGGRVIVIETKEVTGNATRNESLQRFRKDEAS